MATYPLKNISIGGDTYQIPIPPVFVIKCSDPVAETSWTDWQTGGHTLTTPVLYKDGEPSSWSELTPESNVSFEYTSDGGTNFHTYKLSEVSSNPDYGSSTYQFEYIGSEAGSLPNSFAYIVRLGFFNGNMNTKKGYRVPLAAQAGGGGGSVLEVTLYDQYQAIPIGQFDSSSSLSSMRLVDSSSTAKTFNDIFNAFKAGEVIINVGGQYDVTKRHFKVVAVNEGNPTSIVAVYMQSLSPRYVSFEYSGSDWNMTKN